MRTVIISTLLVLSACSHKADTGLTVSVQVPELPSSLSKKADRLPVLSDPSMGALVEDGTSTDIKYNSVSNQLNNLIDAYNCVKDSLNNKRNIETCL